MAAMDAREAKILVGRATARLRDAKFIARQLSVAEIRNLPLAEEARFQDGARAFVGLMARAEKTLKRLVAGL